MPVLARLALSASVYVACAGVSGEADAKASFMDLAGAVETARTIAIVHVERVEPADFEGEHFHYRQRVDARVVLTIKGVPGERIEIAAMKTFICAPVEYEAPADYLVFLADDHGHAATVNHDMGALRIDGGFVEWPYGAIGEVRAIPDAVLEVQTLVGWPAVAEPSLASPPELAPAPAPVPAPVSTSTDANAPLWIASGALAVLLGMLAAGRRRRR